jgi:hypothetical protein
MFSAKRSFHNIRWVYQSCESVGFSNVDNVFYQRFFAPTWEWLLLSPLRCSKIKVYCVRLCHNFQFLVKSRPDAYTTPACIDSVPRPEEGSREEPPNGNCPCPTSLKGHVPQDPTRIVLKSICSRNMDKRKPDFKTA